MVYIIGIRNRPGIYKIGQSRNIKQRLNKLQTGCPDELYILVYGDNVKEFFLHNLLHDYNIRGEWFQLEYKLLIKVIKWISGMDLELVNFHEQTFGTPSVTSDNEGVS